MSDGKNAEYDFEQKEREAMAFMIDEIDLVLSHEHKYRARFDMIQEKFHQNRALSQKHTKMLIKLYEIVTDNGFGGVEN